MTRCVSVVIATHNRSALLARTLDALAGQRWPSDRLEIIVADNRSTDDTRADGDVMPIGANMALRRSVVDRIGGLRSDLGKLDGTLRTGEDHEFFLRMLQAGFRGVYEPDAIVHHWVPRERLERRYFRRWLHQNGRDVAKLETAHTPAVARLLGVPRYLWRQAAIDALTAIRAALTLDDRRRFASLLRLIWFAGYVRSASL